MSYDTALLRSLPRVPQCWLFTYVRRGGALEYHLFRDAGYVACLHGVFKLHVWSVWWSPACWKSVIRGPGEAPDKVQKTLQTHRMRPLAELQRAALYVLLRILGLVGGLPGALQNGQCRTRGCSRPPPEAALSQPTLGNVPCASKQML
jgi:hypothetical protein